MSEKIIAYRLVPVTAPPPGAMSTTAVLECAATGKVISSRGGGGVVISPEFYDRIMAGDFKDETE